MELYYYFRDMEKRPIITICLLNQDDKWARGVAICSDSDMPNKRIGRGLAKGRAVQGLKRFEHHDPVRRIEAFDVLREIYLINNFKRSEILGGTVGWYKSLFSPSLTEFEQKLIESNQPKKEEKNHDNSKH